MGKLIRLWLPPLLILTAGLAHAEREASRATRQHYQESYYFIKGGLVHNDSTGTRTVDASYTGSVLHGAYYLTAKRGTCIGCGVAATDTAFAIGYRNGGTVLDSLGYAFYHADISALPADFFIQRAELWLRTDSLRAFGVSAAVDTFQVFRLLARWSLGSPANPPFVDWVCRSESTSTAKDTTWSYAGAADSMVTYAAGTMGKSGQFQALKTQWLVYSPAGGETWPLSDGVPIACGIDSLWDARVATVGNRADRCMYPEVTACYQTYANMQNKDYWMRFNVTDQVRKWQLLQNANYGVMIRLAGGKIANHFVYLCSEFARYHRRPQLRIWGVRVGLALPEATGSCCAADGTCSVTQGPDCGGTWTESETCSPNPCNQPTGSCCAADGTCAVTAEASCVAGRWKAAEACSPNPCVQPGSGGGPAKNRSSYGGRHW